jgi:hypothetical protein
MIVQESSSRSIPKLSNLLKDNSLGRHKVLHFLHFLRIPKKNSHTAVHVCVGLVCSFHSPLLDKETLFNLEI